MPLKLVKPRIRGKSSSKNWRVRGTYLGVYIDASARTSERSVAAQELAKIQRDIEKGRYKDGQTFAEAALAYMKNGGERTYVGRILEHFRDTPISQMDQDAVDEAAIALYPTGTAATRNRSVYTPISAILSQAGCRLHLRRPRGGGGKQQTAWLWPEQAFALLTEADKLDKEFGALCVVLLYTGMRLSEALGLTWNNVRLEDGFAYIPDTKNDDPRAVFLPPVAVAAMAERQRDRPNGRVFRFTKSGHLYSLLRVAAIRAEVDLPDRSAFHIFRHTYATWMRRYGGLDSRGLVATGAWKDRKSADRYAHTVTTEEAGRAVMLPAPNSVMKLVDLSALPSVGVDKSNS